MSPVSSPNIDTDTPTAWRTLWPWVLGLWLADLAIKFLVSSQFIYAERLNLLPVFDLTLVHNTGAAFSFLAGQGGWQRWFFAVIGIAVSIWLVRWLRQTSMQQRLLALSLAAILAGALGNLTERVVHGYVVDYLLFYWPPYYFPAFNLADMLIFLGASGMVLDMWFESKGRSS